MKRNPTTLAVGLILLAASVAHAAGDGDQNSSNSLTGTLLGYLPILAFLLVLLFLFRYQLKSPTAQLQRQYLQRQIEHTQRVEELLERIASALEKGRDHDA